MLLVMPNFIFYSKEYTHHTLIHLFTELRGTRELEIKKYRNKQFRPQRGHRRDRQLG